MSKLEIPLSSIDVVIYDTQDGTFTIQTKEALGGDIYRTSYSDGLQVVFALDRLHDASNEMVMFVDADDVDEEEEDEDSGCKSCTCR